jgi:hypothetical protein
MKLLRVILIPLVASVVYAGTAEFSGEIVKSEGARVTTGKIHVKGEKYRLEFPDPAGPTIVSIADPKADSVMVLVPRYKLYMADKYSGNLAKMNDPFAAIAWMRPHYESKMGGKEKIGDHECEREDLLYGEAAAISIWKSTKLGFPLKVSMLQQKGYWTEIRKVREEAVSGDLMAVPEGYTKATREEIGEKIENDPEMKAKREKWKKERPRSANFGKFLGVGDTWWILFGRVTKVDIEVNYGDDVEWWAIPYKDGKALSGIKGATVKGMGKAKLPEDGPPEMVCIGVTKGSPSIKISVNGKLPLVSATREISSAKSGANRRWSPSPWHKKLKVTFTAGEVEIEGEFKVNRKQKIETHPLAVAPGKTVTFEFTDADKVTNCDYMLKRGSGTIEVVTDMRPPEEQKKIGN